MIFLEYHEVHLRWLKLKTAKRLFKMTKNGLFRDGYEHLEHNLIKHVNILIYYVLHEKMSNNLGRS